MRIRRLQRRTGLHHGSALLALLLCPLVTGGSARASDPLGLYLGAAYGEAHVRAQLGPFVPGSTGPLPGFDATHSAYQAILGMRPISFLGAEITYIDLGRPSRIGLTDPIPGIASFVTAEQASQKGEAAYALLYLPVPVIDVYVKAGLSRITTDAQVTYTLPGAYCPAGFNCETSSSASITNTSFAYGAGVQWKLGDWSVRGEYERFSAAGENPTLLSIGMSYWLP
jgi:opacity protein-like surface antigen